MPGVEVVRLDENVGFAAGNNLAVRAWRATASGSRS